MRKGSQRVARCEKIKRVIETAREGNLKNLSEDLPDNGETPTRHRTGENQRGDSEAQKPPRRKGARKRIRSVNSGRAVINRKSPSKDLPLESHSPQTFGEQSQRARAAEKPPQQNRREVQGGCRQGAMRSAGKSAGALNRMNRPQVLLLARRLQLRDHLLSRRVSKASGTKAMESSDPSLVRRASAIRKVRMSSKSRLKRHVKTPSRARKGAENIRQEQRSGPPAERRESNAQQQRQRGDQKAQGEKSGPPQGQQQKSRATAKRAREKRVTPRAKATATHRAAKDRARRGEASRPRLPTVVSLDFVAETTIFSGYEKIVPRFRLRGVRLGFGVCRRLLLGQEVQGGRQDRGFNQAEFRRVKLDRPSSQAKRWIEIQRFFFSRLADFA